MGMATSMNAGYFTIHSNVCMPPIEMPMTAWRCFRCSALVTRRYSASTMSLMVIGGNLVACWVSEFEGEEDTPSPKASTAIKKNFAGSIILSAPTKAAMLLLLPENHEGNKTALEPWALSAPQVR